MNFTTQIPISKSSFPIDYQSEVLLLGSCFAENIAEKFHYFKFQAIKNPFGIIFNPVSIENLINRAVNKIEFTEKDIFFNNNLWHCFEVHSKLSNPDKTKFLNELNVLVDAANKYINTSTHIIITLGTSWVYRHSETKKIVANCHKVPQKEFTKELLSVEVIEKSLQNIISLITSVNPDAKFIFTVSPVRHIKDGFFENNVSKAHLISAIHQFLSHRAQSRCLYFPSYEILIDELRDYRFYAEDMLHPSQTAIDYIWEKFCLACVAAEASKTMDDVDILQKSLLHKPFYPGSETHRLFLQNLESKKESLRSKHPHIVF